MKRKAKLILRVILAFLMAVISLTGAIRLYLDRDFEGALKAAVTIINVMEEELDDKSSNRKKTRPCKNN